MFDRILMWAMLGIALASVMLGVECLIEINSIDWAAVIGR